MRSLSQDLRLGARNLAARPRLTLLVVVTLALGIGATTTIFSLVDAVLLRSLELTEPDRLTMVWLDNRVQDIPEDVTSYPNFVDWRDGSEAFASMAAFVEPRVNLTGEGDPQRIQASRVSEGFFTTLGVGPALGRELRPEEQVEGNERVVILSHELWQQRFAGDAGVAGRTLEIDGAAHTVVGVMPADFDFPPEARLWLPLAPREFLREQRGALWLRVIGRLAPGVAIDEAQANMDTIAGRLASQYPETNADRGIAVEPLEEYLVGDVRRSLLILLGAVGLLLLIACVNVANLLLARATGQARDFAIQTALGASRWQIVRQLLVESLLLALVGCAFGLLLTLWAVRGISSLTLEALPRLDGVGVDGRVLLFAVAVSVATGILFGLFPAVQASRPEFGALLQEGSRATVGGRRSGRTRRFLVVGEVALALVLLVGAGLLAESFRRLRSVDPGFVYDDTLALRLDLPRSSYTDANQLTAFAQSLLDRVRALPGVTSVAKVGALFEGEGFMSAPFTIDGRPPLSADERVEVVIGSVSPGFFRTMGIPILEGRDIMPEDNADGRRVAVISRDMAQRWWPGESPLGARFKYGDASSQAPWLEIVGVAGEIRNLGLDREPRPATYMSDLQSPSRSFLVLVRTEGDPLRLAGDLRQAVWAVDDDLPVVHLSTLETVLGEQVAQERFSARMLGLFAILALTLAVVGIYGTVSYWVTQNGPEIAIRMTLGASRRDTVQRVVAQGTLLTVVGIGIGLVAALLATRWMASLLFGVSPTDPWTFAGVSVLLLAVALAATYLPARRAASLDPAKALRSE